jgi:hypothetical protein
MVALFFSLLIFDWHKLFLLCFHIHYVTHVLLFVENYNLCSSQCCSSQNKRHIRGPTCNSAYFLFTYFLKCAESITTISGLVQFVQSFASEHLKTPLEELVKGNKNKSTTELWVEKFYKKVTNLPEPFPHDLVEKLEEYLDVSIIYHTLHKCTFMMK